MHLTIATAEEKIQELTAKLSWRRFCDRPDETPELWPARVRMLETVRPYQEMPVGIAATIARDQGASLAPAAEGEVYSATSNRYGAVCVVVDGQLLGVKPSEFEIVAWATSRIPSEDFRRDLLKP